MSKRINPLKRSRYFLEYFFSFCAYHFVRALPLRLVFILADIAGFFLYLFPPAKRLITANLKVAFPEKDIREIRRIARRNAASTVLFVLEFFWFAGRHERLVKILEMDPEIQRIVTRCDESGRGIIWVTPHLGNWELARIAQTTLQRIKMAVVVRAMNNPYLDRLINGGRTVTGTRVIEARGAVKGMIQALKDGMIVATLIDQNTRARDGGVFIDFFGLPASTSRAPAMFGKKFNAFLAVGGAVRTASGYKTFVKPLPKDIMEYDSDEAILRGLMALTEDYIRQYPEQYLWMYERWRYIPEDIGEDKKALFPYYAVQVTPRFYSDRAPKDPSK
ncbi:MAG: lysophospholipid acyltransferase family protein [Victivallales bacterium]|nr:lysophospholipid acyltransferase family protein [Victivallales bacterium]